MTIQANGNSSRKFPFMESFGEWPATFGNFVEGFSLNEKFAAMCMASYTRSKVSELVKKVVLIFKT